MQTIITLRVEGVVIIVSGHVVHRGPVFTRSQTQWRWIYHPPVHNGNFCWVFAKGCEICMHKSAKCPKCTDVVRVWKVSIILKLKMICYFRDGGLYLNHQSRSELYFKEFLPLLTCVWNLSSELIHHHKISVSVNVTNSCFAPGLPRPIYSVRENIDKSLQGWWQQKPKSDIRQVETRFRTKLQIEKMCFKKYWQISAKADCKKTAGDLPFAKWSAKSGGNQTQWAGGIIPNPHCIFGKAGQWELIGDQCILLWWTRSRFGTLIEENTFSGFSWCLGSNRSKWDTWASHAQY